MKRFECYIFTATLLSSFYNTRTKLKPRRIEKGSRRKLPEQQHVLVKTLLLTDATGKQGGTVIQAICAFEISSAFNIIAVTRSTTSRSAQALASHPNVFLVEGYLDNAAAIFNQIGSVWVSLVSELDLRVLTGRIQGRALVDASVANGVSHLFTRLATMTGLSIPPTTPLRWGILSRSTMWRNISERKPLLVRTA